MKRTVDILKLLKLLMMACFVVLMLTACNGDDTENRDQAPITSVPEEDQTACWQVEVINPLYDLMGKVALKTYRQMTGGAMSLMMVAFALWMTKRLIEQLSSFKEETMGEVWTEIAKMFFLCFVCGLIASKVDLLVLVLGDAIFPIYNAFLEFADSILRTATPDMTNKSVTVFGKDFSIVNSQYPVVCNVSTSVHMTEDATGFPDSPKQMMNCMACSVNHSLSFGMTMALEAMTKSSIVSWLVGLWTFFCFLMVKLAFIFYLVDTIFRFTVMVVMLPLMIMCYPFPKTRGILGKGVNNMFNSAGFMLFFAIIITMCTQAMHLILNTFKNVFTGDDPFAEFSIPFICMMMIAFLVVSSVKIAGKLCDSFIGGKSNAEFQKDAKALIVGALKWGATLGMQVVSFFVPKSVSEWSRNKLNKVMSITGDKEAK
ncbi:MAG: hypothetical protein IJ545_00810 [Alphaproteobacteria bacterium]|nr:hypothetical protein [Alphaproteobacteria bacterium]